MKPRFNQEGSGLKRTLTRMGIAMGVLLLSVVSTFSQDYPLGKLWVTFWPAAFDSLETDSSGNRVYQLPYFSGSVDRTPYLLGEATPDSCNDEAYSQPPPEEKVAVRPTVPTSFELSQNYPNPFNPTATIQYALPKAVQVELKVFNILGQVVRTLVDEEKGAGYHQVVWDGTDQTGRPVSTGIYLYQIKAGDFVETKKMQLIK